MNTDELLEKIEKIIEAKLKAEREHTRNLVREEVKASEERVMKKIDGVTEEMAEFFHKTWEKMDETNERVTIIEDHLGLSHPTKN